MTAMEVILTKNVENLGMKNEVVRVKTGYARNYLLPKKLAIVATKGNRGNLKHKIEVAQELRQKRLDEARLRAEQLSAIVLNVRKKAGREGRLFGSVTSQEVANMLQDKAGFEVDRRKLTLPEHIKQLGSYLFQFKLEPGIVASIKLEVMPIEEQPKEIKEVKVAVPVEEVKKEEPKEAETTAEGEAQ